MRSNIKQVLEQKAKHLEKKTTSGALQRETVFLGQNSFAIFEWLGVSVYKYTLPEANIASENMPSQKETSIPAIHFQGLC